MTSLPVPTAFSGASTPVKAPLLSILIISRTAANLNAMLAAIAANGFTGKLEVLCSWNGDQGGLELIERPAGIALRVVEQRPYNFARNNNALAAQAQGEFVLFLNDDIVLDRHALERAVEAIRQPGIGIVGINLRYADGRLQHAGVFFDENGRPFHRLKHQVQWTDPAVAADMFVPSVTGAFLLMRKEEFASLRFDEAFEVCGEDIALNLSYREKFDREILYLAGATAVHVENATRKETGQTKTPPEDMERIRTYAARRRGGAPVTEVGRPKIRIVTENPGWIMHRMAEELQKHLGARNVVINQDWQDADIHYYINYGYFRNKPRRGLTLANFTHFDPDHLAETFVAAAHAVDHCVAISQATADALRHLGVADDRITTIVIGADVHFRPKLTLGVAGRVYPGGRKGEDIVRALLDDPEVGATIRIVAASEGWGAPVWQFDDPADFYRAIDFLLVPSRIEGGPVPFMEALACGTMSVAPAIGVIPQFPHVPYPVGDTRALKAVLLDLARRHVSQRRFATQAMRGLDWTGWASTHEKLFRRLLAQSRQQS